MSYTKIIAKQNGERARIVVTDYALPGFPPSIGVDVFKQHTDGENWVICTQDPDDAKAAKAMSVADYVKHGRHPMFSEVTHADLLKAQSEAKRFGYNNPLIETTLHITHPDGTEATIPVIVHTADGRLEDTATESYLRSPESVEKKEREKGLYRVKVDGTWTVAEFHPAETHRPERWLWAGGMIFSEELDEISDERISMPDDSQELEVVSDTSKKAVVMHLHIGEKPYRVETTPRQQCRVVDLPELQQFLAHPEPKQEKDASESFNGPS